MNSSSSHENSRPPASEPSATFEVAPNEADRIAALEAELEQLRVRQRQQKVKKTKREWVKATFNALDGFVRFYNTGETYFSRIFTLVSLASILVGASWGVSRLSGVDGRWSSVVPQPGLDTATSQPASEASPAAGARLGWFEVVQQLPASAPPATVQPSPPVTQAAPRVSAPAVSGEIGDDDESEDESDGGDDE